MASRHSSVPVDARWWATKLGRRQRRCLATMAPEGMRQREGLAGDVVAAWMQMAGEQRNEEARNGRCYGSGANWRREVRENRDEKEWNGDER